MSEEECIAEDDDEQERRHEIVRWKFQIAFLVVSVILFLLCVVVVSDVILQFRGSHLQIPDFLVSLCQLTITAGLTFLGVGGLQTLRVLLRKQKEALIGKDDE